MKKSYLIFCLVLFSCGKKQRVTIPLNPKIHTLVPTEFEKKPSSHFEPGTDLIEPLPPITKSYFRCKGSALHSPKVLANNEHLFDCRGFEEHSLPIVDEQEYIQPILIDLANYLQQRTEKKLIITSGHRCPKHQLYLTEKQDLYAKYQIGAQMDFYIEDLQDHPEIIISILEEFFEVPFQRYYKDTDVSEPPWYNKEVFVKFYNQEEGRSEDNDHDYPFISIQVRFDRYKKKHVRYTWDQAYKGYYKG